MKEILGIVHGEMNREPVAVEEQDATIINSLPNPPLVPVSKDDIYVRRCRLASDAIDCGFGRFRTEYLSRLLELTQGAPMLIGHKKNEIGIARFFGGNIEKLENVYNSFTRRKEQVNYIVPKFYWMRSHSKAEDLCINIDGGIYNQVSLSWWYTKATCGICGDDMRKCMHVPGRRYGDELAFYYYDDVLEVLEGSIVFSGGQPNTGFYLNKERLGGLEEGRKIYTTGKALSGKEGVRIFREDIENYLRDFNGQITFRGSMKNKGWSDDTIEISCDAKLEKDVISCLPSALRERVEFPDVKTSDGSNGKRENLSKSAVQNDELNYPVVYSIESIKVDGIPVYIEPLYDGIPVTVIRKGKSVQIMDFEKNDISANVRSIIREILEYPSENFTIKGEIAVYRGRARMDYPATHHLLKNGEKNTELTLKLKISDILSIGPVNTSEQPFKERRNLLESFFFDTRLIQVVKGEPVENSSNLHSIIERVCSRDGAVVKLWEGCKGQNVIQYLYRKRPILEVKIMGKEIAEEGYKYLCGLSDDGQINLAGITIASPLLMKAGDIIRLEVLQAEGRSGGQNWKEARVVSRMPGKVRPDTVRSFQLLVSSYFQDNVRDEESYYFFRSKEKEDSPLYLGIHSSRFNGEISIPSGNKSNRLSQGYVFVNQDVSPEEGGRIIEQGKLVYIDESEGGMTMLLQGKSEQHKVVSLRRILSGGRHSWMGSVKDADSQNTEVRIQNTEDR